MLINSLSASATEILAGAFQDLERAFVIGENSYGKGSVQTPFSLSDGSLVKVTTAKWYTPKDRSIDETGIAPDLTIHFEDTDYKEKYDRQLE
jgi:carboxyl-terminal processing protease